MGGPWSDLPPPPKPKREPWAASRWRLPVRRGSAGREPFINNWRGLLIIAFLLFVAPVMVRWLVQMIHSMVAGG